MSLISGVRSFTDELEGQSITFGIIGGLAVFAYGGDRTTFDVDFLIHQKDRLKIVEIAKKLNLKIFNENPEVIQLSGKIQLDVVFANRERAQLMLTRLKSINGFAYPVVAPEDLIGLKIQAFVSKRSREFRDKGDILTIFKKEKNLNFDLIKEYADLFGVWDEIEDLRKRV